MKIKYKCDNLEIIDAIIYAIEDTDCSVWNDQFDPEVGQELIADLPNNNGHISVIFPKIVIDNHVIVEVDKKSRIWMDKIIKKATQKVTEEMIKNSVFNKLQPDIFKQTSFIKLENNEYIFNELQDYFSKLGFKKVTYHNESVFDIEEDLTIVLCPHIQQDMEEVKIDSLEYERFLNNYKDLPGYSRPDINNQSIKILTNELSKQIIINEFIVGQYFEQRNLVLIYLNPFYSINLTTILSYQDNIYLGLILDQLQTELKKLKLRKMDNETFRLKNSIFKFNRLSNKEFNDLVKKQSELAKNLAEIESDMICEKNRLINISRRINTINQLDESIINEFIADIEKTKAEPFIDSVKLEDGNVLITFKDTTIRSKLCRNQDGIMSGNIYDIYIGKITVKIPPTSKLVVTCDYPILVEPRQSTIEHPHCRDNSPCLGQGAGTQEMLDYIAMRKFSDFIYLFWMWIKKYNPSDCYCKPYSYLDDRLRQGLPVFDQSGNRVTLNDETLIKSGDLIKLEKYTNHDENIEKFKNFKIPGGK